MPCRAAAALRVGKFPCVNTIENGHRYFGGTNPLSLATLDSSPKGTPLGYTGNFIATAKSRPLGEGGIAAGDDGRGTPASLQMPFVVTTPPVKMGFRNARRRSAIPKIKIILPLNMASNNDDRRQRRK